MRRPSPAAPAAPEVHVPRPEDVVGKPTAPPSSTDVLLGGEIAAPSLPGPLYRTGVPSQAERLGPNVVGDGDGGYRQDRLTFKARVDHDGSVHFVDRANIQTDDVSVLPLLIVMGGHFDLTDKLMQLHGEDPYRYEKAKFMEATREERAAMALADRHERLADALIRTPKALKKLWRTTTSSVAERKLAIFALWEEVAEDGDDQLVAFGAKVRTEILLFIRRELPEGGAEAFTPVELEELNKNRKCKARFEPYHER